MKYLVLAKTDIQELTGQGYEALADRNGNVIALFCCGFLSSQQNPPSGSTEPTLVLSEAA